MIIPAILASSKQEFRHLLDASKSFTDFVQIDFVDPQFASNKTVMPRECFYEDFGHLNFEAHIMAHKDQAMPLIDSLKSFSQCTRIIIHREAAETLEDLRQLLNRIRNIGKETGVAINPETDIREVGKVIKKVDLVLFMGVTPGHYGSAFHPQVLDKIQDFQKRYTMYQGLTSLDGGVTKDRLADIQATKVDMAAAGSAIFGESDPEQSYQELSKQWQKYEQIR